MNRSAFEILDSVIRLKPGKERPTALLKGPAAEMGDGWYMCVPPCFNDALDLKLTPRLRGKIKTLEWTQGASFSFGVGDTLYDTADAYKVWSVALNSIEVCVQVKAATPAGFTDDGTRRLPGSVTFSIFTPNEDRTKIVERGNHTMSQDDFVRFLVGGSPNDLRRDIEKTDQ